MHRVVMASRLLISLLSVGCAGLTVPKGELQTFEVIISERVNTSDIPKGIYHLILLPSPSPSLAPRSSA